MSVCLSVCLYMSVCLSVADNRPGFIRLRPDETRTMPCPIGTYQDQKWQYTCISCGGHNYRTDLMAATSARDCKCESTT